MTSEINSTLKNNTTISDIIKNIFPCGSVTGAPKIRTMEIINEIEKDRRNIYTGSIGLFLKDKVCLNVAIRTLVIDKKNKQGNIGLGSGIVWDSNPKQEYEEVKLKSRFLTSPQKYFEIFETALVKNSEVTFLEEHLLRLRTTAEYFLFKFDEKALTKKLSLLLKKADKSDSFKLKIILNKYGNVSFKISEFSILPPIIKVILSANRINSQNKFQYFKTTNRILYDREYKKYSEKGFFDVIYQNENKELAEGAITNIFIKKGDIIITPPIISGILPGVYRSILLKKNPEIKEKKIFVEDLIQADEVFLTNSVRGQIKVDEIYLNEREYISYHKK
jgi:para-aminobenzoate synthetase/4-amino-4-deoxychorismate lyase